MQAQTEKGVGELLGETHGKTVSWTIKEITPHGIKMELNQEGEFAGSLYSARELDTVNVFQKADGTSEWEAKVIHMTNEGEVVVSSARGTGKATGLTTIRADGESILMTQSPRLSSVNMKKLRIEITADTATGEFHSKAYIE